LSISFYDQIAGLIPQQLGNLRQLQWLDLSKNLLTGSVPTTVGQLKNLKALYACINQLEGNKQLYLSRNLLVYFL